MTALGDTTDWASRHVRMEQVASTNSEAMRLALEGRTGPLWVIADRQTAGRGRLGRSWLSPEGNLAASLLLTLDGETGLAGFLPLVAGIAAYDAVVALAGGKPIDGLVLKWPNDVLIDHAKLVGILVESAQFAGRRVAVIGFGLNLAVAPAIPGRQVAALSEVTGRTITPLTAAKALDNVFLRWLAVLNGSEGIASIRAAWMTRTVPLGTELAITTPAGPVSGRFAGLDSDGALLLGDEGGVCRKFNFGDVTLASAREMS